MHTSGPRVDTERVEQALGRLAIGAEFSVLPQSLDEVLRTPADHDQAFTVYGRFLEREPGFAARVLSLANSPALGARSPMREISAAMVWLGTMGTRNAILGVAVMDTLHGQPLLLMQSIACAVFCGRVGQMLSNSDARDLFVPGLLHNVGKLLIVNSPRLASSDAVRALVEGSLSPEEECAAFGCTHCEVSAWLAQRWWLPDDFTEALMHYCQPPAEAGLATQIVARGSEWTRNFARGGVGTPPNTESIIHYFETAHGIPRDRFLAALEGMAEDIAALSAHITEDPPDAAELIRILQRANIALGEVNAQAEVLRLRTEEQMRHLRLLQEIASSAGTRASVADICHEAAALISKRMGLGVVSIMLPNPDGGLFVVAGVGVPRTLVGDESKTAGGKVSRRVFEEGIAILVKDFLHDASVEPSPFAKRYTTASALSVPLMRGATVCGVLNLNNKHDGKPFEERDLQLFETIGHHLGSLLHAEDQRARREQADGRFRALAASTPAALVGFDDSGRVWLWNRGASLLTGVEESAVLGMPIPTVILPDSAEHIPDAWLNCLRTNTPLENAQGLVRGRGQQARHILYTVVPLEEGRVGVWMAVNVTGERNARLDAQKRALEIAAMNRVLTRILAELDRERMLGIFVEEMCRVAGVEKGALVKLAAGAPSAVLASQGMANGDDIEGLLAWTAEHMPTEAARLEAAPIATSQNARHFLTREGIRNAAVVRVPVPHEQGFVLLACNAADAALARVSLRVLEDMATVAAIGLRVADDMASRVRYEQLRTAASMAITYNHEVNNALQVIQAAVDFANRQGSGIAGDDLSAVARAIHIIQALNEALGSHYVPAFRRYADGSDMIAVEVPYPPPKGPPR